MEELGLPWEAGSYLLQMCSELVETMGAATPLKEWPPITGRQARWCWRVHLAAPGLEPSEIFWVAELFCQRDLALDVLGIPLGLADLEAYLAFRPWESEKAATKYWQAIKEDRIPQLPSIEELHQQSRRVASVSGQQTLPSVWSFLPGVGDKLIADAWAPPP